MMEKLTMNGYTVIASLRRWEEWTIYQDHEGYSQPLELQQAQDEISTDDIVTYSFRGKDREGNEYYSGDHEFNSLVTLAAHVWDLKPGEDL